MNNAAVVFQLSTSGEPRLPPTATMGDDSEWMKLPIDQKCEHKVTDCPQTYFLRITYLTKFEEIFFKSNNEMFVKAVFLHCNILTPRKPLGRG